MAAIAAAAADMPPARPSPVEVASLPRAWCDPAQGIVASIVRLIRERDLHPSRVLVLLPYQQLIRVANDAWACCGTPGFTPRFETTRQWARRMGAFVPGADDIAFDMARDLPTAQSLLTRVNLARHPAGLDLRLMEIALQLAPLAAAMPPAARLAWAQRLQPAVDAGRGVDGFDAETVLNRVALAWASTSAYATDVLHDDAVLAQVDQLVMLDGLQHDPLAEALARRLEGRCRRLGLGSAPPADAPPVRMHAALDPEDEAERAAACVLRHLAEGRAPVALAAIDRALTRRISAQLTAAGASLCDETGWRLSTTRVAATVMSALRAGAHDAPSDAVLDWLKGAPGFDAAKVRTLEGRLRERGSRDWSAWCGFQAVSDQPRDLDLLPFTNDVEAQRATLARSRPLVDWLAATQSLLEVTGVWRGLEADEAGRELIAALGLDAPDASARSLRWTLAEFTAWVRDVLEAASFQPAADADSANAVVVLPLHQLLGRPFGAVVLAGCDDQRLPAAPEPPGNWSAAQRIALDLPTREVLEAARRAAWAVAMDAPAVDVLWRRFDASGEPVRPSALVQMSRFAQPTVNAADPRSRVDVAARPTPMPKPRGASLAPSTLSSSAYEDLRACPYRFFARRLLGLREHDELDADIDKRDFGNWLHAVLGHFHEALQVAPTSGRDARRVLIGEAERRATREAGLSDAEFLPFAAAWPAVREGYLDWLAEHEAEGAVFVESEPWKEVALGRVRLVGRLDRVDATADGMRFVIDYKTESADKTKARVKDPSEDTQLAFYAALLEDDRVRAAYVNVGEKSSGTKSHEQPAVVEARDALVAGVIDELARIDEGAAMPALGEGAVCTHCAARGLCRKDFWADPDIAAEVGAPSSTELPRSADGLPAMRATHVTPVTPAASSAAAGMTPDDAAISSPIGPSPATRASLFPAYTHDDRPIERAAFYAIACDPRRSVVVEACAGAGKTWMLVSRVLRALLEQGEGACRPHEILAITFTKKAAGEMRERLEHWLEEFAGRTDAELVPELTLRGMWLTAATEAAPRLRHLHHELLAAGRPVQFRTFHAWFAGLLRTAPLAVLDDLQLPADYQLLEDDAEARARVWRPFNAAVLEDAEAAEAYHALVATHGRSQIANALDEALTRRVEFALADAHGHVDGAVESMGERHPAYADAESPDAVLLHTQASRALLLAAATSLGRASAPTYSQCGVQLEAAVATGDVTAVIDALMTTKGAPRKFNDKLAGIDSVRAAQQLVLDHCAAAAQHAAWLYQQRMARLVRILLRVFAEVKRAHGWIDMNDVELAARVLLGRSDLWGWVQERLDARVRHLLVDEFQDTNPLQWHALHGWLEAYAGAGGRRPGVFIVGDPKQSIYRFRRAEPRVFVEAKRFVAAALDGDLLACDHTHRNAQAVIALVNGAMDEAQAAGELDGFRAHTTESRVAGRVLRLPAIERDAAAVADTVAADGTVPADMAAAIATEPASVVGSGAVAPGLAWRDSLTVPRVLPEERLLQKESRQAARWISTRIAEGLQPGEIMVLSRRRDRLSMLQDELRKLQIAVQQPEKSELADAPEVQDIVALIDVLVSPDHDLSLARALRSPLFAFDDDALVLLAERRRARRSSWFELLQAEDLPDVLQGIGSRLLRWQRLVAALPPHDALSAIYDEAKVLERFAAAVPAAARARTLANLRGLLSAALQIDGARFATPYALVRALRAGGIAAPGTASEDAVQLLTVHGAKGLEARLVLLLDTDGAAPRAQTMGVLVRWPGHAEVPERFVFLASERNPPACATDDLAHELAARQREEVNALYVAMTRARDTLVLSSVRAVKPNPRSWWARLQSECSVEAVATEVAAADADGSPPGPDAAAPPTFAMLAVPRLASARPAIPPAVARLPRSGADDRAAAFGSAMHRLLEWARPGAHPTPLQLRAVARDFGLDAATARAAASAAERIRGGAGAWVWDDEVVDWQDNEVALLHAGRSLRIDRLVRRRDTGAWWVLDYKSAARPEHDAQLQAQLSDYREAVRAAHPGAPVHAAFLTGQGAWVELPP